MSAAAPAGQIVAVPQVKRHLWATAAIVLIDVLALEWSLLLGCLARYFLNPLFPISLHTEQYEGLMLGVLTLPIAYFWVGLYPGYGMGAVQRIRGRVLATFFVFLLLLVWNYSFQGHQWSRGVLLLTMCFALVLAPALEAPLRKLLIARGICGVPVVILGGGATGALVVRTLQKESDLGFMPLAVLDDNPLKWGGTIEDVPVAGPLSAIRAFEGKAKVALIAIPHLDRARLANLIESLSFPNIIVVPDLFGIQSLWTTSRDLGGVLGLELKKNLLVPANRALKRMLDYALAAPLLLLSTPFVALCAVWIRIASRGPAFFRQEREGRNGKRITVLKLRTMYSDSERVLEQYLAANSDERLNWLSFYKLRRDPRILPRIGWFLRRYSLDELPQLWNVLRGDMSLVGPRPFPDYHLDNFSSGFRALRATVTPGITGLWQVSARSEGDLKIQELEDTYYIRNWSLWLDVYILLRTLDMLLTPKGAY
jgi:Undecaprenyl-phosphate galactose phosphotransferase WbaP